MRPNQRKNFYAQKFHSRLGPFTNGAGHVRVPKEMLAAKTPAQFQGAAPQYGGQFHKQPQQQAQQQQARQAQQQARQPQFEPEFQAVPRKAPPSWEDDEPLSAATFRARALERALRGEEPQNSAAPQRLYTTPAPKLPLDKAAPSASSRASVPRFPVRATQQVYASPAPIGPAHAPTAPAAPARSGPTPVVNAELTSLDVMIGNSALTVQPKLNLYPRAAYLLSDAETPDLYSKDTVAFSAPSAVCCVELVLELSGPLGRFDQYDGAGAVSVSFFAGSHAVLAPCRCLADYLMHGRLESYEFGDEQLHLFRLPLGFAEGQGIVLRDRAKLRVVLEGELPTLKASAERHRFFVRYYEEK
jgi:hypothetical protein